MFSLIQTLFAALSTTRHGNQGYDESDIVKMTKTGSAYTAEAKIDGQVLQLTLGGRRMQVVNKEAGSVIRVLQLANPSEEDKTNLDCYDSEPINALIAGADPEGKLAVWIGDLQDEYSSCTFIVGKVRDKDDAYIQKFQRPLVTSSF